MQIRLFDRNSDLDFYSYRFHCFKDSFPIVDEASISEKVMAKNKKYRGFDLSDKTLECSRNED